mmetsp:Transcript_78270/g.221287  ORF Transcript_78270/g.221287 Transcript_78270/m.221287 type:complete len:256 (-) Transcript_78270:86-853(-)
MCSAVYSLTHRFSASDAGGSGTSGRRAQGASVRVVQTGAGLSAPNSGRRTPPGYSWPSAFACRRPAGAVEAAVEAETPVQRLAGPPSRDDCLFCQERQRSSCSSRVRSRQCWEDLHAFGILSGRGMAPYSVSRAAPHSSGRTCAMQRSCVAARALWARATSSTLLCLAGAQSRGVPTNGAPYHLRASVSLPAWLSPRAPPGLMMTPTLSPGLSFSVLIPAAFASSPKEASSPAAGPRSSRLMTPKVLASLATPPR